MTWVLLIASYLLGAIPASYIGGRLARGIDLREHGSRNLGATNAFRVLGWKVAAPIFAFDTFKGWFPAFAFPRWDGVATPDWALAYGAAALIGHMFSIYVRFRGGKGVATGAGVFLALAPLAVLIDIAVWGGIVYITRYVSVASVLAAALLPWLVLAFGGSRAVFWLSVAVAVLVILAHRANLRRLVRGDEHRLGRREGKPA
ncbi:MAG: glycerol-3-phosphate 1-O-acyltransferase PlsY [Longimicrobiales bacterium]